LGCHWEKDGRVLRGHNAKGKRKNYHWFTARRFDRHGGKAMDEIPLGIHPPYNAELPIGAAIQFVAKPLRDIPHP